MIRWTAIPVAVVAAALCAVSPALWLSVLFGIPALAALIPMRRWSIGSSAQSMLAVAALAVGLLVPRPFLDDAGLPGTLSASAFPLGCAALLVAVSRLYVARPFGGSPLTMAAALIALTACGRTDSGWVYVCALGVFVVTGVAALWADDPNRAPLRSVGRRHVAMGLLGAVVAGAVFAGLGGTLPPLSRMAMKSMMLSGRAETGFTDNLWLGSLDGMLQSDRIVLRVRGARADYLRGAVFTSYSPRGQWSREWDDRLKEIATPSEIPVGDGVTALEYVGRPTRYFAPLGPVEIGVATGHAIVDRHGILRPTRSGRAKRTWFVPASERAPPIAEQDTSDRRVPANHYDRLKATAREWTTGATSHRGKLEALEQRLSQTYAYSLDFSVRDSNAPILEFLYRRKTGHCEYFASAMALLARTLGYPARVVGGYRVVEYNDVGEYYVVRERHAHTWVEAWTPDDGWQTFDPTPASGVAAAWSRETPLAQGIVDLVATSWERVDDWLAETTAEELTLVLLGLFALLPLVRWLRERRRRRQGVRRDGWPEAPAFFRELEATLARAGVRRAPTETVEHFAARAREAGTETATAGADLLMRYAALRYGGRGDPALLEREIRSLARARRSD